MTVQDTKIRRTGRTCGFEIQSLNAAGGAC